MGRELPTAARLALVGLGTAGAIAVGAAVGAIVERRLIGRRLEAGPHDYGTLAGDAHMVLTDDGVPLHVEVDDLDDAPVTVVFSHGYALSMHSWHFQRAALRGHARLVFWDQRSHGRSGHAESLPEVDTLGADLGAVIDALVPEGPIVLAGHSMGGMTIMALAARRPDLFGTRVKGVALLATTAGGMSEVTFGMPAPLGRIFHRVAPAIAGTLSKVPGLVESGRRSGSDLGLILTRLFSFGNPHVDPGLTAFVAEMIESTPLDVIADFLPALARHDKAEALAALERVETLVMVGDADLLTPESHSREIVRRVPHAELVVLPSTGHMLTLERHEEVDQRLLTLVARVSGA